MTDQPSETIEIPDNIEELFPKRDEEAPYRTLLEAWRALLSSAREIPDDPISPQWATKIVQTYPEVRFKDVEDIHVGVFHVTAELADILDEVIASDDECLKRTSAEEDAQENAHLYRRCLIDWQVFFVEREALWSPSQKNAAVQLAVLSEVQQMFFGPTGLIGHLDTIGFQYTEDDREELTKALIDAKNAVLGKEVESE